MWQRGVFNFWVVVSLLGGAGAKAWGTLAGSPPQLDVRIEIAQSSEVLEGKLAVKFPTRGETSCVATLLSAGIVVVLAAQLEFPFRQLANLSLLSAGLGTLFVKSRWHGPLEFKSAQNRPLRFSIGSEITEKLRTLILGGKVGIPTSRDREQYLRPQGVVLKFWRSEGSLKEEDLYGALARIESANSPPFYDLFTSPVFFTN